MPGLIAAGVLVGVGVGAMIAGGGSDTSTQTASTTTPAVTASADPAETTPAASTQPADTAGTTAAQASASSDTAAQNSEPAVTPPPAPVAQVYIKLQPGDEVAMNGSPQALVPSPNGFAMLQLPPGDYRFSISNGGRSRDQSITVDREGVWLLNPQS